MASTTEFAKVVRHHGVLQQLLPLWQALAPLKLPIPCAGVVPVLGEALCVVVLVGYRVDVTRRQVCVRVMARTAAHNGVVAEAVADPVLWRVQGATAGSWAEEPLDAVMWDPYQVAGVLELVQGLHSSSKDVTLQLL